MKFVCPKVKWENNREDKSKLQVCHCDNPYTTSSCGRIIYFYPENNLRAYPSADRRTKEYDKTYKIRVNIEKSINYFKDRFCVANRKTTNEKPLHADLLLAPNSKITTFFPDMLKCVIYFACSPQGYCHITYFYFFKCDFVHNDFFNSFGTFG